jgi:glycosyltransferase involved in cell wall biosynthesis
MMAFNLGIIPLASDLNGFQELIKNRYNGFLFKNNSVDDLVNVMEEFIIMSKSKRDIIRENLIKYVSETYALFKFVNNYKLMFDSVISNK